MTAAARCAVFYATNSKHLRFKVLPDDEDELALLNAPPGISYLLASTFTRMGRGCPDDLACRRLIADHTNTSILDADADRCLVLDWSGSVINCIKADPEIDEPPHSPEGFVALGHRLVLHREAVLGDRLIDGHFFRRHIIANRKTGIVARVQWLKLPITPDCPNDHYSMPHLVARVDDRLPPIRSEQWLTLLSSVAPIGILAA